MRENVREFVFMALIYGINFGIYYVLGFEVFVVFLGVSLSIHLYNIKTAIEELK